MDNNPDEEKIKRVLRVLDFKVALSVNKIADRSYLNWFTVDWVLHYLLAENKVERIDSVDRNVWRLKKGVIA